MARRLQMFLARASDDESTLNKVHADGRLSMRPDDGCMLIERLILEALKANDLNSTEMMLFWWKDANSECLDWVPSALQYVNKAIEQGKEYTAVEWISYGVNASPSCAGRAAPQALLMLAKAKIALGEYSMAEFLIQHVEASQDSVSIKKAKILRASHLSGEEAEMIKLERAQRK